MSEKRFKKGDWTNCRYDICEIVTDDDEIICVVALNDADKIIGLLEENEWLRKENVFLAKQRSYWKTKAMTLLMQVRRLTSRMTDKEVIEFSKELNDEKNK